MVGGSAGGGASAGGRVGSERGGGVGEWRRSGKCFRRWTCLISPMTVVDAGCDAGCGCRMLCCWRWGSLALLLCGSCSTHSGDNSPIRTRTAIRPIFRRHSLPHYHPVLSPLVTKPAANRGGRISGGNLRVSIPDQFKPNIALIPATAAAAPAAATAGTKPPGRRTPQREKR